MKRQTNFLPIVATLLWGGLCQAQPKEVTGAFRGSQSRRSLQNSTTVALSFDGIAFDLDEGVSSELVTALEQDSQVTGEKYLAD